MTSPSDFAGSHPLLVSVAEEAVPVYLVSDVTWPDIADKLDSVARTFAKAQDFKPVEGQFLALPGADGHIAAVVFGCGDNGADPFLPGKLSSQLPEGTYRFVGLAPENAQSAVLGWLLGAYRFTRYRAVTAPQARLVLPEGVDGDEVVRIADAVTFGRDLINTPANDLTPETLAEAAGALAQRFGAQCQVTVGDDLLEAGFPMVHAVGRASAVAPRLIDITAGDENWPKVTIVGKGVTFDTGGLDIKPSSSMLLMKKDMGGAAAALALASMLLAARVKIRLRVLVPAVENAISGAAFRPGDVLPSRKGLTVEIGNTDAEGRLVLADALALACEDEPELVIDYATLTGAARVALGPDLPPFYTEDDALAADIARHGTAVHDPVWRLPLWKPYDDMFKSKIADVNHVSSGGFAGSVTAALFLRRFTKGVPHVHFDIFGWTPSAKPGRPEGGEVQGARLVYAWLKERYGALA